MSKTLGFASFLFSAVVTGPAMGAVVFSGSYSQNFDGLLGNGDANGTTYTWADDSTIPGWYARANGALPGTYTVNSGGGAYAGLIQSFGGGASSERALGSQNPNSITSTMRYGVQLQNATSTAVSAVSLQYTGELWRVIMGEIADNISFDYQVFAAGTGSLEAASGWTSVSSLNFTAPQTAAGASTGLNGNSAPNRTILNGQITGLTWNPGDELWLRWSDNSSGGNRRAGVAIDDVTVAVIPEPGSVLLGLGGISLLALRRRR